MITAGIKDAKNNLSRYLALVKAGEDVVITEHGKVVARIIKEGARKQSIRAALEPLISRGLIALPFRDLILESFLQSTMVPEGDVHFNILIQLSKDRNHPIKRKAFKPRVPDARKLGMGYACQFFCFAC